MNSEGFHRSDGRRNAETWAVTPIHKVSLQAKALEQFPLRYATKTSRTALQSWTLMSSDQSPLQPMLWLKQYLPHWFFQFVTTHCDPEGSYASPEPPTRTGSFPLKQLWFNLQDLRTARDFNIHPLPAAQSFDTLPWFCFTAPSCEHPATAQDLQGAEGGCRHFTGTFHVQRPLLQHPKVQTTQRIRKWHAPHWRWAPTLWGVRGFWQAWNPKDIP